MIGKWYTKAKTRVKKITLRPLQTNKALRPFALCLLALSAAPAPCLVVAAEASGSRTDLRFTTRVRGGYGQTLSIHQLEVELGDLLNQPVRLGTQTRLSVDSMTPDNSSAFLVVADPRLLDANQVVGIDMTSAFPLVTVFSLAKKGLSKAPSSASTREAREARESGGTLELVIEVLHQGPTAHPKRSLDYERWKKWEPLRNWLEWRKEKKKSSIRADIHHPPQSST